MGVIDWIKGVTGKKDLKYARMLNGYQPIFSQFGSNIYAEEAVQQSVNCIVREMKKLNPQHVVKEGSDIIPVHDDIQNVLANPNPLMTTTDFIEKITWQVMFNYNAFVWPTYSDSGTLTGLFPLQPTQVEFQEDSAHNYYVKFTFANNYSVILPYADLIHIRYNFANNEFMGGNASGQPDHAALLKTLELNNTILEGVAKGARASYAINAVVKFNTMLDQGKTEAAVRDFTRILEQDASGFLPLDMKTEVTPFKRETKLVDAETIKFVDEKILRHFGVSVPMLTGDYTKEQYEAFYQKTLEPLIASYSQAFTKALFSKRASFGFGHQVVFYPKELIFLNTSQKLEMIRLLGDSGALYENEKRALMGLPPLEGLKGVRMMSLNYVDVNIAPEYQAGKQTVTDTGTTDSGESGNNE